MKAKPRILVFLTLLVILVTGLFAPQNATRVASQEVNNNILARALDIEMGVVQREKYEMPISSGVLYAVLGASGELSRRAEQTGGLTTADRPFRPSPDDETQGCQNVYTRNGLRNIRVNQDCSLRRQAEEVIAVNPININNLIAGQNDSRIGFNHCGYDFSFDGGKTWGDMVPPFWGFVLADGHTADACSDPTVTFDAMGNAYIAGVLFDINSAASAFVVAKSNAGIGGAFYHSPAPGDFQLYSTDPLGVVASDNDPDIFNDKEFIVADANRNSPKVNNVYATWTRFAITDEGVGANSPIFFSQSTDGGATWSPGIPISGSNPDLCRDFSGSGDPFACDQDQGSHPIVGRDGTIYVAFGNGNTPELGFNQVLFVSCPGTVDCTDPGNWTMPTKVGDLIGIHPFGPGPEGCPPGRQCLPPNGYRVPEFTSISISVDNRDRLYTVWSDARNLESNCNPLGDAATAEPPCDNDVFYAYSTDAGETWSDTRQITPAGTAQWQPWSAVVNSGRRLWVGYYDRKYGQCEFTGCNDITLVEIRNPSSNSPDMNFKRLTTSSMPNLTPDNNPVQAGFLGDYMWVTVDRRGDPYVVWADTRGRKGTVEEDIYFYKGD